MRIRLMKKSDFDSVSKLLVESYEKEPKNQRWNYTNALKYVNMLYRLGKDLCFVIVADGKVIACSITCIIPQCLSDVASYKVLLVHPKYRKQKLGTRLIKRTCSKLYNKYNIDKIEISLCTQTNFPVSWYERLGFRNKKNYELLDASVNLVLGAL